MKYYMFFFCTLFALIGGGVCAKTPPTTTFSLSGYGVQPDTVVTVHFTVMAQDKTVKEYTYTPRVAPDTKFEIPIVTGVVARAIQGTIDYDILIDDRQDKGDKNKGIPQSLHFDWNRLSLGVTISGYIMPHGVVRATSKTDSDFGGALFEYDDGNEEPLLTADLMQGNISSGDYISPPWFHHGSFYGNAQFDIIIEGMGVSSSSAQSRLSNVLSQSHEAGFSFNIETPISQRKTQRIRERKEQEKKLKEALLLKDEKV